MYRLAELTGHAVATLLASTALLGLGGAMQQPVPLAAQSVRVPQFENDNVKVWRTTVMPNAPLTMHRHDHGRVIVALNGGTMKIVEQGGGSEDQIWETGKAYWLPAMAPNTMHADVNAGSRPIEVMVIEMKHDQ